MQTTARRIQVSNAKMACAWRPTTGSNLMTMKTIRQQRELLRDNRLMCQLDTD